MIAAEVLVIKSLMKEKLNPKQEKFCQLYASDREFFGNGVESYMEAYDMERSKYNTAKSAAQRLLTYDYINALIGELLDIKISNEVVDKELGFVIIQKNDLSSKVQAIKEYNRVKQRVDERPQINFNIGAILAKIESRDRSLNEAGRQELSNPELLLDQGQTRKKDSISTKPRSKRLSRKEA